MPKGERLGEIHQRKRDRVNWAEEQQLVLEANHGAVTLLGPKPDGKISNVPHQCNVCDTVFVALRSDSKRGLVRCPECKINGPERELRKFIESLGCEVEMHKRGVLSPALEIDLYIPSHKVGIEYHGLVWHTGNKNAHAEKFALAQDAGIHLIQMFSDEWDSKKPQIKSMLRNLLGRRKKTVGARKTKIFTVDDASAFYNEHHIQGAPARGGVTYGLWAEDKLVAAMTFNRPYSRRGGRKGTGQWELSRYATSVGIQGGASKLFKHFVKTHQPVGIVSYSDQRFFSGDIYQMLNFTRGKTTVDYEYTDARRRWHKSNFQKSRLKTIMGADYDDTKTEWMMTEEIGLKRIYNAGRTTWMWGDTETIKETGEVVSIDTLVKRHDERMIDANERKSNGIKAMWQSEEHRKKMAAFKATLKDNEEFKAKVGVAAKENWKDPEYREKVMMARASEDALAKRRAKYVAAGKRDWVHRSTGDTRTAHWSEMHDEFGGSEATWKRVFGQKPKSGKRTLYSQGWSPVEK